MSWTFDRKRARWICSKYSDLNVHAIQNLYRYGFPMDPGEEGSDELFLPDFSHITVEMPQHEIMFNGYGANITIYDFPMAREFLAGKFCLRPGSYFFKDLIQLCLVKDNKFISDRIITRKLYNVFDQSPLPAGNIGLLNAMYVHGNVAFGLMSSTQFIVGPCYRIIEAEIGAMDDNWDLHSKTQWVENTVNRAARHIVSHYNLKKEILLEYRGQGRFDRVEQRIPVVSCTWGNIYTGY